MGKIFYLMGKSSSGKDTIYNELMADASLNLKKVTLYTTRPVREGEIEGKQYHFVTEEEAFKMKREGKVLEMRMYPSVLGPWYYFTANDGQIDLSKSNYLMIGTLESYAELRKTLGEDKLIPIFIEVEDGLRLQRALDRERADSNPKYAEMCRRFLADSKDFADDKIEACGITERYENIEFSATLAKVKKKIREEL